VCKKRTFFIERKIAMVKRIDVALEQTEYSALLEMANDDLRNPSDQLRHILRLEIERRLDNKGNHKTNQEEK